MVLNEEGTYRLFDLQGDYQQYSLGTEAAEMGIVDARLHESGLVALTGSLTLLEVKGWDGGRPLTLANPGSWQCLPFRHRVEANTGLAEPPRAWAVIPPDQNVSRHVEVLLSVDSTILAVDNLESVDQRISRGPFSHVSPSPNGRLLALLNHDGLLWVVSTDFQRSLAEFNTQTAGADGPVSQVEWCSNDAILVTWNNLAILVGPSGDTLQCVHQHCFYFSLQK